MKYRATHSQRRILDLPEFHVELPAPNFSLGQPNKTYSGIGSRIHSGRRRGVDNMASTKRKRPPSRDVDDDNNDEWDIKNWTSRHYDYDAYDDISENATSAIERDLFDHPSDDTLKYNTNKRKKKYGGIIARNGVDDDDDDGSGGGKMMMDEDGMFLSLEVLPANTYTVERTGDEVVGYVTKVIYKERGETNNAAADTLKLL